MTSTSVETVEAISLQNKIPSMVNVPEKTAIEQQETSTSMDQQETKAPSTSSVPMRNPKDSMKSTWRSRPKSEWSLPQHVQHLLGINYSDKKRSIPVHQKNDPMPVVDQFQAHRWVLMHALWPLVLHQLYTWIVGPMSTPVAVVFYIFSFHFNAVHQIRRMRDLGHIYGFLDGDKHDRDDVPDSKSNMIVTALSATATIRPMVAVLFAYRAGTSPLGFTPWIIVEIGLYGIVLDFYYYWYHRAMHQSDSLWKFHRTHHMTKHPTALLTLYADGAQEVFDLIGIPFLTYGTLRLFGMPMTFADWWMCQQYIVFTELWGHSGLRLMITAPTTSTPLLRLLDAELVTEDHDLHHRKGWKKSHNYGKQTLLWDRVFGTCHERYESLEGNIDWKNVVALPWWGE